MAKFYKVVKDHPALEVGAILQEVARGYRPISDLWTKDIKNLPDDYVEVLRLVEGSDWFERVYEVTVNGDTRYMSKADAQAVYAAQKTDKPQA